MRRMLFICVAALASLLAGCSSFGYYLQSIDGQMKLLQARRPIADVIADPATPPQLRARLERALAIRDFASRELKLPDNESYRSYADVRRRFVVWNVFATAEFSVGPQQWCFPVAGCVGYRGYFEHAAAETFAQELRGQGRDVFVSGVPAYSTLGWFDDPVLNTFVNYPEPVLARLIFHELAHQRVYVKDDTEFNESFAVAVEHEGVRRWLARHGDAKLSADFALAQQRRVQFQALVLEYRGRLTALYQSGIAPADMRARKAQAFSGMQRDYEGLRSQWGGFAGYDRFFKDLNNAHLASVAIYTALVPQFEQLIAKHNGDLAAFYAEVEALAALGKEERAARLAALVAPGRQEPL